MGWNCLFRLWAIGLSWLASTLLFAIIISAALHPSGTAIVDVDRFGERWLEVAIFSVIWGLVTWNFVRVLKNFRRQNG